MYMHRLTHDVAIFDNYSNTIVYINFLKRRYNMQSVLYMFVISFHIELMIPECIVFHKSICPKPEGKTTLRPCGVFVCYSFLI